MLADYPAQAVVRGQLSPLQESLKRGFDIVGATAGLVLLSPLIILVSLAIKLDSRGPVFCRLKYYNLNDAVLEAFEFRSTMSDPGHKKSNFTANSDHKVTQMGQVLRRSSIDKVPQLINVLRGDMSLVGPQPLVTASGAVYRARIAHECLRNVKPGVVGWAQIRERANKASPTDKFPCRIEDDCHYLVNRSFLLDMKILVLALFLNSTQT